MTKTLSGLTVALGCVLAVVGAVVAIVDDDSGPAATIKTIECRHSGQDVVLYEAIVENKSDERASFEVEVRVKASDGTRLGLGEAVVERLESREAARLRTAIEIIDHHARVSCVAFATST